MTKTIYFVRHAESQANADGIMAGSEFETPLTKNGQEQAKKAGEFLKDKGIELIISSPMQRTMQTAQIIAKELGIPKGEVVKNKLLVERALGKYSGKPKSFYISQRESGTFDQNELEPEEALFDRVQQAMDYIRSRKEKTILLVSHGGTGRMFRLVDQKLHHGDFHTVKRFDNAEVDVFTLD